MPAQEVPVRFFKTQLIDLYLEAPNNGGLVYDKGRGVYLADYVRPMLTTKWHQQSPFSDRTPGNYPAGCVAIAVAQIMAYHEYPRDYCNWPLVKKYDAKNMTLKCIVNWLKCL